jgi:uncharacterized protein YebE (UPF0316 family)
MGLEEILLVLAIFGLRVLNNAIGTVRVIVTSNGRRNMALGLAFIESLIFAYTAGQVLTNLENIPNLIAYAGGFAVGGYVGILIEEKFVKGYVTINVISVSHGHEIALKLREQGYGVTETIGEGGQGQVAMLMSVVLRQDTKRVINEVHDVDDKAFITVESARTAQYGWVRSVRNHFRAP